MKTSKSQLWGPAGLGLGNTPECNTCSEQRTWCCWILEASTRGHSAEHTLRPQHITSISDQRGPSACGPQTWPQKPQPLYQRLVLTLEQSLALLMG